MSAQTGSLQAKRMVFNGALNIYEAAALKSELCASLEQAAGVGLVLDLSRVDEIDLAGLQLLMLARRECLRLSCPLQMTGLTAAVEEVVRFCNLGDFFGESLSPAAN